MIFPGLFLSHAPEPPCTRFSKCPWTDPSKGCNFNSCVAKTIKQIAFPRHTKRRYSKTTLTLFSRSNRDLHFVMLVTLRNFPRTIYIHPPWHVWRCSTAIWSIANNTFIRVLSQSERWRERMCTTTVMWPETLSILTLQLRSASHLFCYNGN